MGPLDLYCFKGLIAGKPAPTGFVAIFCIYFSFASSASAAASDDAGFCPVSSNPSVTT
jgi:hypothetical protein